MYKTDNTTKEVGAVKFAQWFCIFEAPIDVTIRRNPLKQYLNASKSLLHKNIVNIVEKGHWYSSYKTNNEIFSNMEGYQKGEPKLSVVIKVLLSKYHLPGSSETLKQSP